MVEYALGWGVVRVRLPVSPCKPFKKGFHPKLN